MISLVQMKPSNGSGSVKNNERFNLHFSASILISIPCLLQDTSCIHQFHPPKQLTKKKQKILKKSETFLEIASYCFALCTQKPALREVDLEPSPKGGSDKINMLRKRRRKKSNRKQIKSYSVDSQKGTSTERGTLATQH